MIYWCESALIGGVATQAVRIHADSAGQITRIEADVAAHAGDVRLGTVLPGMANAHSHAFHRALRGRTHANGGTFWVWRETMYAAAAALDPASYYDLAKAVFAEMVTAGWTAVGEFHYVHHSPDGTPYGSQHGLAGQSGLPELPGPPDSREHAMELALVSAAREVGIRLTLLDTSYLRGGIGAELSADQRRFGDGSANGWLKRWHSLNQLLGADGTGVATTAGIPDASSVVLGAALHSVRALTRDDIRTILDGLPAKTPLHIHLSEQPQENIDCLAEYGLTPTELLDELGSLSPRLSVVHATHLSARDIALLGDAGVGVVMCPTTEADLADGIGPARALADAGARIALGSDQNAVVDPFLEARGLEAGERLATGFRGRFNPAELLTALTESGYQSLGLGHGGIRVGSWCDLVEVDAGSVRTTGSATEQLVLTATASDVLQVIVGGRLVAVDGQLYSPATPGTVTDPAVLLRAALSVLAARTNEMAS
ncbi:amidohydrolase family protein [Leifsonia sp. A12D58]|uniref:amidohydrolase family protein n=1 Tax=Leifsonia sp. A12D58 TaxID=3397674 RepID=UPI0039E0EF29